MAKKIIETEALCQMCIKNGWLLESSGTQLNKVVTANEAGCNIQELAAVIWAVSCENINALSNIRDAIESERLRVQTAHEKRIVDFIFRKIPSDWNLWDIERRRSFWRGAAYTDENKITGLVDRDRISAAEIWCELLNGEMNCMTITETKTLNNIIASTNAWEVPSVPMRFGPYGVQRGFIRKE